MRRRGWSSGVAEMQNAPVDYRTSFTGFCDKFLPYTETGSPWRLADYERSFFDQTYVFRDGVFVPRTIVHSEPKKHGKTFLDCGCVPLWWGMTQGPTEIEIYANDADQSEGLGFATAAAFCKRNGFEAATFCKVRA